MRGAWERYVGPMRLSAIFSFFLAIAALALSGCGIKGDLATPAPLWGEAEQADAELSDDVIDAETLEDDVFDEDDPEYGIDVAD